MAPPSLYRGATTGTEQHHKHAPAQRLWELIEAGVFLSEELQLDAVLRRIVETACRVIGTRYGALGVLNESRTGLSNFIFHGLTEADRERIGDLPVGRGLLGALIEDPKPIRLADLSRDARSVGFPDNHPPMTSFLGVPIRSRGEVYGNLYLTEKQAAEGFSEEDEQLAIVLAGQAGAAIENARLFESARSAEAAAGRRLMELESVHELGIAVLSEVDPERVLRIVARRARELVRADTAAIALRDGDELVVRVAVGVRASVAEGLRVAMDATLAGAVMKSREPVLVPDALADDRMSPVVVRRLNLRSVVLAPLVQGSEGIGVVMLMHDEPERFSPDDLFAVSRFASLASLGLYNATLVATERRRADMEAELAETRVRSELRDQALKAAIRAQEDERSRIARELHDSAGQALASILLGLKVASDEPTLQDARARLSDLREIAAEAAGEVRRISRELRPSVLDDLGLEAALERLTSDIGERTTLKVSLSVELSDPRFEPEFEIVLYRVAQEALTNTVKYAGAGRVDVSLEEHDQVIRLTVADDGSGFDPQSKVGLGLGLRGMEERAELVGGSLDVRSTPGAGTTVVLDVPKKLGE